MITVTSIKKCKPKLQVQTHKIKNPNWKLNAKHADEDVEGHASVVPLDAKPQPNVQEVGAAAAR